MDTNLRIRTFSGTHATHEMLIEIPSDYFHPKGQSFHYLPFIPNLLTFPSQELPEFESFNCLAEEKVDMERVKTEAFFEPVVALDNLYGLPGEKWCFDSRPEKQAPPSKREIFKPTSKESMVSLDLDLPSVSKLQDSHQHNRIGCRCGMSKCLRLHCRCFKDLEYCAQNCKCTSCFNNLENEETRSFVIQKTKEINKNAFKGKMVYLEYEDLKTINTEGCLCKTGCNRNYCECFKNNTGCSSICKCIDCKNTTLSVPEKNIQKLVRSVNRKKKKIIIQELTKRDEEASSKSENLSLQLSKISLLLTNDSALPQQLKNNKVKIRQVELTPNCMIAIKQYKKIKSRCVKL